MPGSTFDASTLDEPRRERFHRNLRAVEQVLAGASPAQTAAASGLPLSTLGRPVKRIRKYGAVACVLYGTYTRQPALHPCTGYLRYDVCGI